MTHRLILLSLLLIVSGAAPLVAEPQTRIFYYGEERPEDIEAMVRSMVTEGAQVVLIRNSSKIFVKDEPENLHAIAEIFNTLNAPRPNVKVSVEFIETGQGSASDFGVHVETGDRIRVQSGQPLNGNRVTINTGNGRVQVGGNSSSSSSQTMATQFLVTQSGRSATIRVGQEIPVVDYFRDFIIRGGYLQQAFGNDEIRLREISQIRWESVGTQMSIKPTVLHGGLIQVDLVPEIRAAIPSEAAAKLTNGARTFEIALRNLTTSVTVAPGARIHIGGFQGGSSEFNSRFFQGQSRADSSQKSGFTLCAELMP